MNMSDYGGWSRLESDEFEAALADNLHAFESAPVADESVNSPVAVCLGESHGSHLFTMSGETLPGTGALLIRFPRNISPDLILDPGWGCIAAARRNRVSLNEIGVVLVSHCHLDHVGDLHPLLVTLSLVGKRPTLIANQTSIDGGLGQPSILPDYFRGLCQEVIVGSPGGEVALGRLSVVPFATSHRENPRTSGHSLSYIVTVSDEQQRRIGLLTDGPLDNLTEEVMEELRRCNALIINIGTISALPEAPSHSRIFDNALCLHGLRNFLRRLASGSNHLQTLAVTHLGAELLEVRSPLMRQFLSQTKFGLPAELLEPALQEMTGEMMRKEIKFRVLREGHTMEV